MHTEKLHMTITRYSHILLIQPFHTTQFNMLASIAKYIKDVSVLRRLLFAVAQLPPDLHTQGKESRNQITAEQVKLFVENLLALDGTAFHTDNVILQELVKFQVSPN